MASQSTAALRKPRADGVRNRERVLEAAKAVFSAGGSDASLEAVAKRAGVGIGTLYRHFPTREALFEAVYRREVDQLVELADQKGTPEPVDALRRWMKANVELVATKKGMISALALAVQGSSELYAYSFESLTKAIRTLLDRARRRRDPQRHQPRGPAARADRHVLSARPARLAVDRAAADGCVHRRPSGEGEGRWQGEGGAAEEEREVATIAVIASEAKQSIARQAEEWIASSQVLLAMTRRPVPVQAAYLCAASAS
jgi:Transcriptional regulator